MFRTIVQWCKQTIIQQVVFELHEDLESATGREIDIIDVTPVEQIEAPKPKKTSRRKATT